MQLLFLVKSNLNKINFLATIGNGDICLRTVNFTVSVGGARGVHVDIYFLAAVMVHIGGV